MKILNTITEKQKFELRCNVIKQIISAGFLSQLWFKNDERRG